MKENLKSNCCKAELYTSTAPDCVYGFLCSKCKKPCSYESDFDRFVENKTDYSKYSHSHCWESENPPCGLKCKHRCCLCKEPVPEEVKLKDCQDSGFSNHNGFSVVEDIKVGVDIGETPFSPDYPDKMIVREEARMKGGCLCGKCKVDDLLLTTRVKIGMLRQWLNENRKCEPMITNEDIIYWLSL